MTTPYSEPWEGATRALTATDQPSTPAPAAAAGSEALRPLDQELAAMRTIDAMLSRLDPAVRSRVLTWASDRVYAMQAVAGLVARSSVGDRDEVGKDLAQRMPRGRVDAIMRSHCGEDHPMTDQPPRDEQGRTPRERVAAGLPAYVLTDEQCADVAVASGWIPDTPEARAAYLTELTDIAADEQEN
jgi:hypothetical protein